MKRKAISQNKFVAIEPVPFKKLEAKITAGFATIAQKTDVMSVTLVMDYYCKENDLFFDAGTDKVILRGDSALQQWNKMVLNYEGKEFVLCPIEQVIGFEIEV